MYIAIVYIQFQIFFYFRYTLILNLSHHLNKYFLFITPHIINQFTFIRYTIHDTYTYSNFTFIPITIIWSQYTCVHFYFHPPLLKKAFVEENTYYIVALSAFFYHDFMISFWIFCQIGDATTCVIIECIVYYIY